MPKSTQGNAVATSLTRDGFGAFRDSVFGQFAGQDKPDTGLDLTR